MTVLNSLSRSLLIVLEHIPNELGKQITQNLSIPTIGIGAGSECDGQVLVINDAIGLGDKWPPFSKQYAHVNNTILSAAKEYKDEVENGTF
ncbi:MAG TPA: 3-methyl-2-oxobutanoate hydroxymethyltransferase [Fodinibius sp.]|nr:3-methyl-2-oxobutanoate hydroxymethyltransferase [Fodinibius sp.]